MHLAFAANKADGTSLEFGRVTTVPQLPPSCSTPILRCYHEREMIVKGIRLASIWAATWD